MNASLPTLRLSWFIWSLGATFYLIAFYQRVAPAVITRELMADFSINATALGNLSAFYFYSYVAMQIPTGILADRFGPRRLLTAGAVIAAIGTLLFAAASSLLWANLGRLLIGGSVAVAFVGILKLASHWLPHRQFALATGVALCVGVLGAVFAGVPLRIMVDAFGWRSVMWVSAAITAIIAVAIWLFVRDDPRERGYASYFSQGHNNSEVMPKTGVRNDLAAVLRYRNVPLLFLIPGGIVANNLTFAGLWGVPFLTSHYQLTPTKAAALCSTLMVSWAVAGPLFGWASDWIGKRKPLYITGCLSALAGWCAIYLIPGLNPIVLLAMLILVGFASGCMIISFAYAKESVPLRLGGTVSGLINMGVMLGPMLAQPLVGWALDWRWEGTLEAGIRTYSRDAYQFGFSLPLAWLLLSTLFILFTRETHSRQST